ncbi:hypothetical protein D3C78_1744540 [compost metagenome]
MLQLVTDTKFQDENRKTRVIEAVENPEEIKQRFTLLLSRFNTVGFAPFEVDIMKYIEGEKHRYEVMLEEAPQLFMSQYLNVDSLKDHTTGYILHLSFFRCVS